MKTKAMIKFIAALMLLCPMFGIASCEDSNAYVHSTGVTGGHTEDGGSGTEDTENPEQDQNDEENQEDMEPVKDIVLTIGGSRFTAVLEDNAAAELMRAFLCRQSVRVQYVRATSCYGDHLVSCFSTGHSRAHIATQGSDG